MSRRGFVPIVVAIIIVAVLVAGGAYLFLNRSSNKEIIQSQRASTSTSQMTTSSIQTVTSSPNQNNFVIQLSLNSSDIPVSVDSSGRLSGEYAAYIVLTDSSGRRAGKDPATGVVYNEIPHAVYSTGVEGGYINFTQPQGGSYVVTITGASSSNEYSFSWIIKNNNITIAHPVYGGKIDAGQAVVYSFTFDPDNAASDTISRISISPPTEPSVLSSSTAQVGDYVVVANCTLPPESDNGIMVNNIDILKDGSTTQTISTNIRPELSICPDIESDDINFDGYPDFMINTGHGATGNEEFEYWIYDTSTNQFSCPYGNSEAYCSNLGGVSGPDFDSASKTITESWTMGCAGECSDTQTYQVIDGQMVLIKDVSVDENDAAPDSPLIETTKELISGQMQVVSTTTYSPGND